MDAAQTPYNIGTEAEEARHVCSEPQVRLGLVPQACAQVVWSFLELF